MTDMPPRKSCYRLKGKRWASRKEQATRKRLIKKPASQNETQLPPEGLAVGKGDSAEPGAWAGGLEAGTNFSGGQPDKTSKATRAHVLRPNKSDL